MAQEIARLVAEGRAGTARLGDRALRPRDIAVLVRTSYEAAGLRQVLAAHGVNAVSVGRDGVFNSPEAAALEVLLAAVLDPRERELARLALTSALLDLDYAQIERIIQSEAQWIEWVDQLLLLHQVWQRKGFMSMFQQMLRRLGIAGALGRCEQAERRLTNLLHLGELLQQASKAHPGMDALLGWYREQRNRGATEEAELRLESDEALVQIVTIHASKGLEYPVVFVPYLWGCKPRTRNGLLAFHRDKEACLDAGSDAIEDHLLLAEQERLAEDVRLAYVALTRARGRPLPGVGAGRFQRRFRRTNRARLAAAPAPVAGVAGRGTPDAFAGLADLEPDLQRLAKRAPGDIVVSPLPMSVEATAAPPTGKPDVLAPRRFSGQIATDWRINSFSALTRDVHSGPAIPRAGAADDPAMQFPAGSHVGSYLHLLLECLDFRGDVERQVLQHSAQVAARFNLDHERWGASAAGWLARVVATPLDGQGLRLAQLAPQARLNELEFDFSTQRVDIPALNALLVQAAGQTLPPLEVATFRGMVTGIIDLVFEYEGRFYIADYKSNFLGGQFGDYERPGLEQAVYERRYDLQYLLYTLALHRYLRQRLRGYDYARHFGGIYYLFLRGMRPESGPACGVYFVPARAGAGGSTGSADIPPRRGGSDMSGLLRRLMESGGLPPLAYYFARFVARGCGADEDGLLARSAALVSLRNLQGDVCVDLGEYTGQPLFGDDCEASPELARAPALGEWLEVLAGASWVGRPGMNAPLILDRQRLYLGKYWQYEQTVAEALRTRLESVAALDTARLIDGLRRLFGEVQDGETDWQKVAAAIAVSRRFAVISGGPGTGKTTTVVKVLALLLEQDPGLHIALAAPTGKAAARLTEAIRGGKGRVDAAPGVLERIPEEASTLHRLLGAGFGSGFRYNRDNPLVLDCLVVDEASMIDLPLMARLLEALPPRSRLILLGDRDQLASVEAGNVLGDITGHGQEIRYSRSQTRFPGRSRNSNG